MMVKKSVVKKGKKQQLLRNRKAEKIEQIQSDDESMSSSSSSSSESELDNEFDVVTEVKTNDPVDLESGSDDSSSSSSSDNELENIAEEDESSEEELEGEGDFDDSETEGSDQDDSILSSSTLSQWELEMENPSHYAKCVRRICSTFSSALTGKDFQASSGDVFNRLIVLALKKVPVAFDHIFKDARESGKPSTSKKWNVYQKSAKAYVKAIIELLNRIGEVSTLSFVLTEVQNSLFLVICFPKLLKPFVRSLLGLWTNHDDEKIQLYAFLAIKNIAEAVSVSSDLFEICLKLMYLEFMRRSKFYYLHNKDRIQFMQNCLLEMYSIDLNKGYLLAFSYIRQLATHLRNGMTNLVKEKIQAIYNWQFLNCMTLWMRYIARNYSASPMIASLAYPIVQVAMGTLKLQKSIQFAPFHLHVVTQLNGLSQSVSGKVFIPLSQFLVESIVEISQVKKAGTGSGLEKMLDLSTLVRVTKSMSQTRVYRETILTEFLDSLVEHLSINCGEMCFMELIVPINKHLKPALKKSRFIKSSPMVFRKLKQLLIKLKEQDTVIRGVRFERKTPSIDGSDYPLREYCVSLMASKKQMALTQVDPKKMNFEEDENAAEEEEGGEDFGDEASGDDENIEESEYDMSDESEE